MKYFEIFSSIIHETKLKVRKLLFLSISTLHTHGSGKPLLVREIDRSRNYSRKVKRTKTSSTNVTNIVYNSYLKKKRKTKKKTLTLVNNTFGSTF